MSAKSAIKDRLKEHKFVAILRGIRPKFVPAVTEVFLEEKLQFCEITLDSSNSFESLRLMKYLSQGKIDIGVGTVLTPDQVKQSVDLGATFIISPHFNREIVQTTLDLNAVSLPGCLTPSEIVAADQMGADYIKLFPMEAMSLNYLKALKNGPLKSISFVPTGGITVDNALDFLKAGATALGVGGSLFRDSDFDHDNGTEILRKKTQSFLKVIRSSH